MYSSSETQFLSLLRFALSGQSDFTDQTAPLQWDELLSLARKHALVGVLFSCFSRLPASVAPSRITQMKWGGLAANIRQRNLKTTDAVLATVDLFQTNHFQAVLLKGQGLGIYYPDSSLRSAGDIDILVYRPSSLMPDKSYILQLIRFAKSHNPADIDLTYHHCQFGDIDGVEVELHWFPSWFYCPWYNRRFQHYCFQHLSPSVNQQGIPVPSLQFNTLFLLVHIYRHLFYEGIGLKQLVDYYYFLLNREPISEEERRQFEAIITRLGLRRFTRALMYIMSHSFGLPSDRLLSAPEASSGNFLLSEILVAGNLGKFDSRNDDRSLGSSIRDKIYRLCRNFKYLQFGPLEVLFTPLWRVWRLWWVRYHNTSDTR